MLLVGGAEIMVRGAAEIANRFGIPPLIIGLTVVAFGTSAPEMAVAIKSAFAGQADIALGNVVGSNILNILLILGLASMITPLIVGSRIVQIDVPILVVISVALFAFSFDGQISFLDGAILFAGSIIYTVYAIFSAHKTDAGAPQDRHPGLSFLLVIVGLAMLVFGADLLVTSAVSIARWLGVSELLIGLTVISIGTSLPEIATTVVAALRGLRDMAVGNVVGSCLFNIMAVTGAAAVFSPTGLAVVPALIRFDMPVMLAATIACLPIFATGHLIARWEGFLFFLFYLAYTTYLITASHAQESVELMHKAMLSFVIPLTFLTLCLLWLREIRKKNKTDQ
ncbi:UNVERIFIED_CONTAM: hypothetical protein GTU68_016392 [Idotea baltica]|nr:hypothetical protein [Idotea baltica]